MSDVNEVIKELDKIDNKTEKCFFVLGEEFSVNELMDHLRKGTDVGKEFHQMHIKLQEKISKIKLPD